MTLKLEELENLVKQLGSGLGVCEIANDNSESQIILSGHVKAINEVNKTLKTMKKRSVFLPVSAPFHCSLMKAAADKMDEKIKNTTFKNPKISLVANVTAQEVKDYIRFIGNRRLAQLGLEPIYKIDKNPLTWLDTMLNAVEHMNFFEGRATEYSKASTQGTWTEAFS